MANERNSNSRDGVNENTYQILEESGAPANDGSQIPFVFNGGNAEGFSTGYNWRPGSPFGFSNQGNNPNTGGFGGFANPFFFNGMGQNGMMDPYSINGGDAYTSKSIVKKILIGRENYVTWKTAMEIALSGRSQLGFVRGEYPKPSEPNMALRWQRCNDVIMSWLISSVSESIGEHVMRARDVSVAWNSLQIRYGGTNLARKSVLIAEIANCVQGENDVAVYYDRLENIGKSKMLFRKQQFGN